KIARCRCHTDSEALSTPLDGVPEKSFFSFLLIPPPPRSTLFPYTTLFRSVGRNVTVMAGGQLITWTMTLLWTLVVPRSLGPSGMGTIMAAWSITGILGIVLGLGTRNYLVREAVIAPEKASGLIGTALLLRIALSPVLLA